MKVTHGSWNAHHMTTILILARYSKRKSMQPLKFHLSSVWFTFLRRNGKTISYGNLSLTFQLHRCPIFWWRNMVKSPFWWVILRPTLFLMANQNEQLTGDDGLADAPSHWLITKINQDGWSQKKTCRAAPKKRQLYTPKRNPAFVLINNYCGFSRCP